MKISRKIFTDKYIRAVFLLLFLFAAGITVGCLYASIYGSGVLTAAVSESSVETGRSFARVYSGFLFDYAFCLTVVFVFGATFLGIAVIPAAILLKGAAVGVSLFYTLYVSGFSVYLQKWLICWPSVLCAAVWILFSVYAYGVSLRSCRALRCKGHALSLRAYLLFFCISLLIFAVSGVIYCFLFRIAETLS